VNRICFIASIIVLSSLLGGCASSGHEHMAGPSRQEEVAMKGASVMPFDLMRTTHFFDDTATGGVETVTANDKSDAEQVTLIRSHLATEAERFGRGDFSDPAKIHGADMRGLAALSNAGAKLRVAYLDVPGGARLAFESRDPAVIAAIHDWFAAQRADHAAHGHMHEQMHEQMHH
jgi:hypothetical protein